MYACIHTCSCVYMYICIYVYMYICIYDIYVHIYPGGIFTVRIFITKLSFRHFDWKKGVSELEGLTFPSTTLSAFFLLQEARSRIKTVASRIMKYNASISASMLCTWASKEKVQILICPMEETNIHEENVPRYAQRLMWKTQKRAQ